MVEGDPGRLQIEDPASPDTLNLPTFEVARDVHRLVRTLATIGVRHIHVQHLGGMDDSTAHFVRNVAMASELAYDVTLHDYTAVCPASSSWTGAGCTCGEPPVEVCEH